MKHTHVLSVLILLVLLIGFADASPARAAGPITQFDATALALQNGDTVTTWGGQTAAGTPTFLTNQTPNGMPAVEFNGGDDHMGNNVPLPAAAAGDWILVAVIKPQNIGAYHNLADDDPASRPMLWIDPSFNYELNFGGGGGAKAAGTGPNGWDIVIADSRLNQLYVNSATPNAFGRNAVAYSATKNYDFFHRDGGQTYRGLVAEMRIYTDRAEFGGDFAALHSEMVAKYFDPLNSLPVSRWPGDGTADDVVGDNNGTLQNGAGYAPGIVGEAFSLYGGHDFIDVGSGYDLNAMTLAAWVYIDPTTNTGDRRIISKDNYTLPGTRKFFALKSSSAAHGAPGSAHFEISDGIGFEKVLDSPWPGEAHAP